MQDYLRHFSDLLADDCNLIQGGIDKVKLGVAKPLLFFFIDKL